MASGVLPITLPLAGLNRSTALQQSAPYTSPGLSNVRPRDIFSRRVRLGSRPGLIPALPGQSIGSTAIACLATVRPASKLAVAHITDVFSGVQPTALSTPWSKPGWTNHPDALFYGQHPFSSVTGARLFTNTTAITQKAGAALRDAITDIDPAAAPYSVLIRCAPSSSLWSNSGNQLPYNTAIFYLWAAMSNAAPDPEVNSAFIAAFPWYPTNTVYTLVYGYYSASVLTQFSTTIAVASTYGEPFALSMTLNGSSVTCFCNSVSFGSFTLPTAQAGQRMAVGITGRSDVGGSSLPPYIDEFSASYATGAATGPPAELLVGIGTLGLYHETSPNTMSYYSAVPYTLRVTPPVDAVERAGKLFIADYLTAPIAAGTTALVSGNNFSDGALNWLTLGAAIGDVVVIPTGTAAGAGTYRVTGVQAAVLGLDRPPGNGQGIAYRVERPPKVWDPSLAADKRLQTWLATIGDVPCGCPLAMLYQDCLFLGAPYYAPHTYFASKQGNPFNWDFSQVGTDPGSAFAGTQTNVAVIPGAMTAMFSHSTDYAIMATSGNMLAMRGHPLHGGSALEMLSWTIGIVDQRGWCAGPGGETFFLSRKGIGVIAPGAGQYPQLLSKGPLPQELQGIRYGDAGVRCCMIYDIGGDGIHVYLSPVTPYAGAAPSHWWFDLDTPGWWKDDIPATLDPFSVCHHDLPPTGDRVALLGCRGTIMRQYQGATTDNGTAISSYVLIGPIRLGDTTRAGVLAAMLATLATNSANVTWEVYVGDSPESAYNAAVAGSSPFATSTWSAGLNYSTRPRARGVAAVIKILSSAAWAIESLTTRIEAAGMIRKVSA